MEEQHETQLHGQMNRRSTQGQSPAWGPLYIALFCVLVNLKLHTATHHATRSKRTMIQWQHESIPKTRTIACTKFEDYTIEHTKKTTQNVLIQDRGSKSINPSRSKNNHSHWWMCVTWCRRRNPTGTEPIDPTPGNEDEQTKAKQGKETEL